MTTWAVEVIHDGGQKDGGRMTKHLVIDDETQDLLAEIKQYGYVYSFEARRTEPGDLAKLAFGAAGAGTVGRFGTGPEGGAPR